jgi:copper chaperone CopZ
MKDRSHEGTFIGAGLLAAIAGSLCCIGPLLALITGSGSVLSMMPWLSAARPYLIAVSILALSLAFWQAYKRPKVVQDDCGCTVETKRPLLKSKTFLWIVTALSVILFAFPYLTSWSLNSSYDHTSVPDWSDTLELSVDGMTCQACEAHIVQSTKGIEGVFKTEASYSKHSATIWYDRKRVEPKTVIETIEQITGYNIITNKDGH